MTYGMLVVLVLCWLGLYHMLGVIKGRCLDDWWEDFGILVLVGVVILALLCLVLMGLKTIAITLIELWHIPILT